jgi:MFS family permease
MRRYFQFFLVVLAAGAIYPIMYLRTNYQETLLTVFNMTFSQLNLLYSFLGIVFVVGYFPSGLLADRFSAKKLLSVSLFGTAAGGFWFAMTPPYGNVVAIFCIWGFFSVFTFWSSHMKLVKLLSTKEDEGRFFGILDGGRGVVEAALASIAVAIFAKILGGSEALADKRAAIVAVIYMYSFALLVTAILVTIFVKDDKKAPAKAAADVPAKEKFQIGDIAQALKNKFVFIMGGIIFLSYATYWTVYYYGGFLETNIKVDPVSVGTIMTIVLWMRPVGGILGGIIADKAGKTVALGGALTGALLCLVAMSFLPPQTAKAVFYVLVVFAGIFVYAIRGTYWSLIGECKINDKIIGVTIGIVSFVGYLPDIVLPLFNSFLFETFGGNGGYNAYFISSAVIAVAGIILLSVFGRLTKKESGRI